MYFINLGGHSNNFWLEVCKLCPPSSCPKCSLSLTFTHSSWLLPSVEAGFPVPVTVLWATWPPSSYLLACVTQLKSWSRILLHCHQHGETSPSLGWLPHICGVLCCSLTKSSSYNNESRGMTWRCQQTIWAQRSNDSEVFQFKTEVRLSVAPFPCVFPTHSIS